jgi:hypothetical protein
MSDEELIREIVHRFIGRAESEIAERITAALRDGLLAAKTEIQRDTIDQLFDEAYHLMTIEKLTIRAALSNAATIICQRPTPFDAPKGIEE